MAMEFTIRYGTLNSLPCLDIADVLDTTGIRWMSMIVFDHQQHGRLILLIPLRPTRITAERYPLSYPLFQMLEKLARTKKCRPSKTGIVRVHYQGTA